MTGYENRIKNVVKQGRIIIKLIPSFLIPSQAKRQRRRRRRKKRTRRTKRRREQKPPFKYINKRLTSRVPVGVRKDGSKKKIKSKNLCI